LFYSKNKQKIKRKFFQNYFFILKNRQILLYSKNGKKTRKKFFHFSINFFFTFLFFYFFFMITSMDLSGSAGLLATISTKK